MDVTVNAKLLSQTVSAVQGACASRSTMPIYTKVRLSIEQGSLCVTATDGSVLATKKLTPKTINKEGSCYISPDKLLRIAKLEDDDMDIVSNGNSIEISTLKDEYEIACDEGEFGIDTTLNDSELLFSVDSEIFMKALRLTDFAIDTVGEGKWSMSGLRIESADTFDLVGTNGKRLAVNHIVSDMKRNKGELLIPKKASDMLASLVDDSVTFDCYATKNDALFDGGTWTLWTRQLEGRFPDYRNVIPKMCERELSVNIESLLKDIRRASVMTDEESKRLVFKFQGDKVTINAQGASTKATVVHQLDQAIEGTLTIAFDPKYLIDFLSRFSSGDRVTLRLKNHQSPAVFIYEGGLHLVVPMV